VIEDISFQNIICLLEKNIVYNRIFVSRFVSGSEFVKGTSCHS